MELSKKNRYLLEFRKSKRNFRPILNFISLHFRNFRKFYIFYYLILQAREANPLIGTLDQTPGSTTGRYLQTIFNLIQRYFFKVITLIYKTKLYNRYLVNVQYFSNSCRFLNSHSEI